MPRMSHHDKSGTSWQKGQAMVGASWHGKNIMPHKRVYLWHECHATTREYCHVKSAWLWQVQKYYATERMSHHHMKMVKPGRDCHDTPFSFNRNVSQLQVRQESLGTESGHGHNKSFSKWKKTLSYSIPKMSHHDKSGSPWLDMARIFWNDRNIMPV